MHDSLKILQLKARHQVYTLLSGHNLSKLHGEGHDFSALREYQVGDDIRKINWTISAKIGKPYIKELHANRELSVVVVSFMDASLYFGSGNAKQETLAEIATIIAYASQHSGDIFTGFGFTQSQTYMTHPTKQLHTINQFSKFLFETPLLHTKLDFSQSVKNVFRHISKPSLLFVIGDFLERVDLSLLAQKHEVIAIVVREEKEESLDLLKNASFMSPYNNESKSIHTGKRGAQEYLSKLQQHDKTLFEHFSHHNIRSVKISTNDSVISKMMQLFA